MRIDDDTKPDERVCAVGDRGAKSGLRLHLAALDSHGVPGPSTTLSAAVTRKDGRDVSADIPLKALGLKDGRHAWQARSIYTDDGACHPDRLGVPRCLDRLPDKGPVYFRVEPLKVVGCAFNGAAQYRRGSGNRIALTFDDGPAAITADFLDLLEREHVPATFFLVGRNVPGRENLLKRMLADGDMIGNHTYNHADVSGAGPGAIDELRRTQNVIRAATGFTPCLFRPPSGSTSPALVAAAGTFGMTTILWDVDPSDYTRPGAEVIESRVLSQAHEGSIVLSHDGGGPREQTLAAVPGEIREFKRRGYEFVTVNELLGLKLIRG